MVVEMKYIRLIKSKQEHEQAVARLMNLMNDDPVSGNSKANELEVLSLLIESYEQEHFPMD